MLPYSELAGKHDILEQNEDTQVGVGDASESGVGMETELPNSNPHPGDPNFIRNMNRQ